MASLKRDHPVSELPDVPIGPCGSVISAIAPPSEPRALDFAERSLEPWFEDYGVGERTRTSTGL